MRRRFFRGAFGGALVIAAALSATAGGGTSSRWHGPIHMRTNSSSTNWSGYAVTGGRYTSVSSSWTVPQVACSGTAYSSFWVGLDGDTSNTVEQTGTDSDCSGSTPQYYAWYEMYPKFPVNLSLAVAPGDSMTGSVTTDGGGHFTLTIRDATTGQSFTTTQHLNRAKLASAEVIAEAPSSSGGVLPLTNFGTVGFSSSTVNGQPIGTFSPDKIDMVSGSTVKAQTSALSGGSSFSVAWKHA
jgi:Peptidase A4 family